jgi:hypothetical protein
MTDLSAWDINVNLNGMPQKIATAFDGLSDMVGASYKFIAYIGSQQVNGVNHAILAEQTILTGKDVKNVVILIFNEKGENVTLVSIERVVESGQWFGGTQVNVQTLLPEDARNLFIAAFTGILGGRYTPIALLGTQMTTGIEHIYAATCDPANLGDMEFLIISINSLTHRVSIIDPLVDKYNAALGYAFTW